MAGEKISGDFNANKSPVPDFDKAIFNQDVGMLQELIGNLKLPKEKREDFLTLELRKACALAFQGAVNVGIIDALIDAGGKVNKPQGRDLSPFAIICQSNDVSLVKHLIARGADVNADANNDPFGCAKPLHFACSHSQNPEIVKELLDHRANPNAKGFFEQTPLHVAASSRAKKFRDGTGDRLPVIDLLLEHGAKVNAVDKSEQTPLFSLLAHNPDAKAAEKLIDAGANLKFTNRTDGSALHLAAERGLHELIDLLIAKGAPLLLKNADGRTPREHLQHLRQSPRQAGNDNAPAPQEVPGAVDHARSLARLQEAEQAALRGGIRSKMKHKWGF